MLGTRSPFIESLGASNFFIWCKDLRGPKWLAHLPSS
jgi:hypothetical protein